MNPDYNPNQDKFYEEYKVEMDKRYGRPLDRADSYDGAWWEEDELSLAEEHDRLCGGLVGRVIAQEGWEGALVLSYDQADDSFRVRLAKGEEIIALWGSSSHAGCPAGVSRHGWSTPF